MKEWKKERERGRYEKFVSVSWEEVSVFVCVYMVLECVYFVYMCEFIGVCVCVCILNLYCASKIIKRWRKKEIMWQRGMVKDFETEFWKGKGFVCSWNASVWKDFSANATKSTGG